MCVDPEIERKKVFDKLKPTDINLHIYKDHSGHNVAQSTCCAALCFSI